MPTPLLSVTDLKTHFHINDQTIHAVDGVSFDVNPGETLCLVGESGSGKTVTVESITNLIQSPPGKIVNGSIKFDGTELTELSPSGLRSIRGGRIGHVFQNPQGTLNPVYTIGQQITEAIHLHHEIGRSAARTRAIDLLDRVGIPDASVRIDDYPHEFSGGMKQRAIIAMALAPEPDLLIADEPTTALDVTIQAQIIQLLKDLQTDLGMSIIFVTHDLGVVAEIADRVLIMYAGKVMERGTVYDLFDNPAHPYTRALFECFPSVDSQLSGIEGAAPDPRSPPEGCRFHPRCQFAIDQCQTGQQPTFEHASGANHEVSCVYYQPGKDPTQLTNSLGKPDQTPQ